MDVSNLQKNVKNQRPPKYGCNPNQKIVSLRVQLKFVIHLFFVRKLKKKKN